MFDTDELPSFDFSIDANEKRTIKSTSDYWAYRSNKITTEEIISQDWRHLNGQECDH
jgi:hypothetical protein